MDLQISVFLLFILFTAGHSFRCYECSGFTGSCADQTIKTCPSGSSKCMSSTVVTQGEISIKLKTKDCVHDCKNGSVNIGFSKMTFSCCDTDLCNVQDAPDPSTVPNGKSCYTCDEKSCSNTVNCTGTEDRCIKAIGTLEVQPVFIKGCASKSICDSSKFIPNVEDFTCCEGNLCNGVQSVSQSFLFLCCSLISYFLLH